jgi:hypothetical protein
MFDKIYLFTILAFIFFLLFFIFQDFLTYLDLFQTSLSLVFDDNMPNKRCNSLLYYFKFEQY